MEPEYFTFMLPIILSLIFLVIPLACGIILWRARRRWLRGIAIGYLGFIALLAFIVLILQVAYSRQPYPTKESMHWGITFSARASTDYGSDWKAAYQAILTEVKPAIIRLPVYWNEVEPQEGSFDFEDLDWQIAQAAAYNTPIMLAVGQKSPRWPECHYPEWVDVSDEASRTARAHAYIRKTAERYAQAAIVTSWQVENEPFLKATSFSNCPHLTEQHVREEVELVKSIDVGSFVVATDSGEGGGWLAALNVADGMGTTMYRKVYNPLFRRVESYPYTPEFYAAREGIARLIAGEKNKPVFVSELQAEPWAPRAVTSYTPAEQSGYYSIEDLRNSLMYAQKSRLDSVALLWGAEWWYSMKEAGISTYWDEIASLDRDSNRCDSAAVGLAASLKLCTAQ